MLWQGLLCELEVGEVDRSLDADDAETGVGYDLHQKDGRLLVELEAVESAGD